MNPINIFALTRIESESSQRRLERQMSGRSHFLMIKEWEVESLRKFCSNLCGVKKEAAAMKFFYSFTMPKLGKEFDLLRVSKDSIVNIELKSNTVSDEAILRQLSQNKYYLTTLGKSMYFFTYISQTDRLVRMSNSGRLVRTDWEELAAVLEGQKELYEGPIEDLFREEDYLISPLTDPARFLRGEYFLTSQQRDIRYHILKRIMTGNGSIRREFSLSAFTGLPGTGKSILLYDIAMQISKRETVCLLHIGSYEKELEQLNERLKRVDFYYCASDQKLQIPGEYAAILIDEGHRLTEELYGDILALAKKWQIPLIATFDKEDAVPKEERYGSGGRLITETEGCSSYRLTNKIRLNNELSSFIASLMRIKGRSRRGSYPSVSLSYAGDDNEAGMLLSAYAAEGYALIHDGELPADTTIENCTGIGEAVCKEYEQVMMLIDEAFFYDEDGYLREKNDRPQDDGISGVRRLYHGLSRAKKKIAVVVKNNPEVFEGILSILQGEAVVSKHRTEE